MLDKNGVIRLGVGIGNLRSFVASKAYSGLTIACVPRLSGREDFRRVDALTWGGGPPGSPPVSAVYLVAFGSSRCPFRVPPFGSPQRRGFFTPLIFAFKVSPIRQLERKYVCRHPLCGVIVK